MLSSDAIAELAAAVCATAEAMGQSISAGGAQLIAEDLAGHPAEVIVGALRACRREHQGRLTLAAILQRVEAADGRPGKDEAWSIALAGSDERETVVLTEEIRAAMNASAPILAAGDRVGARMAFMSAYERLVAQSRAEAQPVNWDVSLGHDPVSRVNAIESAVRMQLLPQARADLYLADLRTAQATQDGQAIAGLLTGKGPAPTEGNRERWQQLKADLEEGRRRKAVQRRWDARKERRQFERDRAAQVAVLHQLMRTEGV